MVSEFKKGTIFPPTVAYRLHLTALLLFAVLGSMLSGLMLSQYVLDFLPFYGGNELARALPPALCLLGDFSLWGCIWDSTGGAVMGMARRIMNLHTASKYRTGILRLLAAVISCYGRYAFFHNGLPDYLLLRSSFVFFSTGPDSVTILDGLCGDHGSVLDYCPLWRNLPVALINQKNESINCIYIFQTKGLCK